MKKQQRKALESALLQDTRIATAVVVKVNDSTYVCGEMFIENGLTRKFSAWVKRGAIYDVSLSDAHYTPQSPEFDAVREAIADARQAINQQKEDQYG